MKTKGRPRKKDNEVQEAPMPLDTRIIVPTVSDDNKIDIETAEHLTRGIRHPIKKAFLLAYCMLGNRTRAAKAAGTTTVTANVWRNTDPVFEERYEECRKVAIALHEDEMFRRASEGYLEPVWQNGKLVGSVRRFSDSLLTFALKGNMPERYGDKMKVDMAVDVAERLRAGRERVLGRKKK